MPLALSPDLLRGARDASGLTRQDVAATIDRSLSAIQSWERGWSEPTATDVARLAAIYGVQIESMFVHDPEAATASTSRGPHPEKTPAPTDAATRQPVGA